jgi:hypothetical protein
MGVMVMVKGGISHAGYNVMESELIAASAAICVTMGLVFQGATVVDVNTGLLSGHGLCASPHRHLQFREDRSSEFSLTLPPDSPCSKRRQNETNNHKNNNISKNQKSTNHRNKKTLTH